MSVVLPAPEGADKMNNSPRWGGFWLKRFFQGPGGRGMVAGNRGGAARARQDESTRSAHSRWLPVRSHLQNLHSAPEFAVEGRDRVRAHSAARRDHNGIGERGDRSGP